MFVQRPTWRVGLGMSDPVGSLGSIRAALRCAACMRADILSGCPRCLAGPVHELGAVIEALSSAAGCRALAYGGRTGTGTTWATCAASWRVSPPHGPRPPQPAQQRTRQRPLPRRQMRRQPRPGARDLPRTGRRRARLLPAALALALAGSPNCGGSRAWNAKPATRRQARVLPVAPTMGQALVGSQPCSGCPASRRCCARGAATWCTPCGTGAALWRWRASWACAPSAGAAQSARPGTVHRRLMSKIGFGDALSPH